MTRRVAVLDDYQGVAEAIAPWDQLGPGFEVTFFSDHLDGEDALAQRLEPFDVIVAMRERTPFPATLIARLARLRLLVTTGMRNDSIDVGAARERGIAVCGTGGITASTAELTWALILAVARHVPAEDANVRAGGWQVTVGTELEGRTLGIIGLGRLGSRVAGIGQAFGMTTIAWSQNLDPAHAGSLGVEPVTLPDLLGRSDVVTIHLRLSDRTRGLIGAVEIAAMRSHAVLVNTSRGPIVDEAALLAALQEGRLGGAGLDVFDVEPLPPDHPLRHAPRTVLTPHIGYVTEGTYRRFYSDAVENIAAFEAGTPVRVIGG